MNDPVGGNKKKEANKSRGDALLTLLGLLGVAGGSKHLEATVDKHNKQDAAGDNNEEGDNTINKTIKRSNFGTKM